jgi:hypothetical protein
MSLLYKLSKPSMSFISGLTSSGGNRSRAFVVAVAYVLSRRLSLPVGKVESLSDYYRVQHGILVTSIMNDINEVMPFDSKGCRKLTEDFFSFRYVTSNPPLIPLAVRADHGVADFFGLSQIFSDDVLKDIAEQPEKITNYVTGMSQVIEEREQAILSLNPVADNEQGDRYVA